MFCRRSEKFNNLIVPKFGPENAHGRHQFVTRLTVHPVMSKFESHWTGVVQALARGAESFRTERRLRAADALRPYRDEAEGREALERMSLEDPSEAVRARALQALRAP